MMWRTHSCVPRSHSCERVRAPRPQAPPEPENAYLPESKVDVVQPISRSVHLWPKDFFELTYGAFADEPIKRHDQGAFDVREALV